MLAVALTGLVGLILRSVLVGLLSVKSEAFTEMNTSEHHLSTHAHTHAHTHARLLSATQSTKDARALKKDDRLAL